MLEVIGSDDAVLVTREQFGRRTLAADKDHCDIIPKDECPLRGGEPAGGESAKLGALTIGRSNLEWRVIANQCGVAAIVSSSPFHP